MDQIRAGRGRLFLVSNRLPLTLEQDAGEMRVRMSAGGLASGLLGLHREGDGRWIGWPGHTTADATLPAEMQQVLAAERMLGVGLTDEEHRRYYLQAGNRCIWPLFHYFTERVHFEPGDWEVYEKVNRRFADAVLQEARDDDVVFVQDFHLMLLPAMLRAARPRLRIGFFLHVPFPSSEVFRILPAREAVLRGMMGADMVAFHTMAYLRHFRTSLSRVLGIEVGSCEIPHQGRSVRLRALPLAIDAAEWEPGGDEDEVLKEVAHLREVAAGRRIVLGVERLDYTKGIPERLRAFRDLLRTEPGLAERVMMIQVAVPSRVELPDYRELKDEVDRLAGSINAEFGAPGRQPLQYMFQSVDRTRLRALYRCADVCLVTPLRDGLNLVAKEYVASRLNDDGVLVLGESTGAIWELGEAPRVNPFDPADMLAQLRAALAMPPHEQSLRMEPMRQRVRRASVGDWARRCVEAIRQSDRRLTTATALTGSTRTALLAAWRQARRRVAFLDYDGTLREFTATPEEARPTPAVRRALTALARAPGVETWVLSGRSTEVLGQWLGDVGIGLIAEHGAFLRRPGARDFEPLVGALDLGWREEVRGILEEFTAHVPGSRIEEKRIGMAWHYRKSDPMLAVWQARELYQHLLEVVQDPSVQVMRGSKVIEVRPAAVHKGNAATMVLGGRHAAPDAPLLFAAGDDQTDESTFRAFPHDWTVLVGARPTSARYRVPGPTALRTLLEELAAVAAATADAGGHSDPTSIASP